MMKKNDGLESKIRTVTGKTGKLEKEKHALGEEKQTLEAAFEQNHKTLQSSLKTMTKKNDGLESKLQIITKKTGKLEQEKYALREEKLALEIALEQYELTLENATRQNDSLESKLQIV